MAIEFLKTNKNNQFIRPRGQGFPTGLTQNQSLNVEVLLVGAGGGGGADDYGGGGGGAGGLLYKAVDQPTNRTLRITISAGEAAPTSYTNAVAAGNTYFGDIVAYGGGSSSTSGGGGKDGGCGAGCSHGSGTPAQRAGGASIQDSNNGGTGYGNAGGATIYGTPSYDAGSGGGAGAAGTTGGAGGIGRYESLTNQIQVGQLSGGNYYVAGGGGSFGLAQAAQTVGGIGGGGSAVSPYANKNGSVNTGGGGGGVSRGNGYGGNGGSGVAILKIKDPFTASFSPGVTVTSNTTASLGNTIYTITATSTVSETVTFVGPQPFTID